METISLAFYCERDPFVPRGEMAHGDEHTFYGVGRPQVIPVLGWEVEECEQRIAILSDVIDIRGVDLPVLARVL